MTHIRRPLIGLIALFTAALTLDRFGLGSEGGNAVSTSAYIVAVASVATPFVLIGLRRASQSRAIIVALGLYVGATVIFGSGFDGAALYLYATEAAFVALAAGLAHQVAAGLQTLDEALGAVAFGEQAALPLSSPQAATDILTEMARSRRHDRPLVVTVVAPRPASLELAVDRAAEEVQRAIRERYVFAQLARYMNQRLRRSDLVFHDEASGRFVVVSPETDAGGSSFVVERIREAARQAAVEVDAGTAAFPDSAISFEALVTEAEERLGEAPLGATLRAVEGGTA